MLKKALSDPFSSDIDMIPYPVRMGAWYSLLELGITKEELMELNKKVEEEDKKQNKNKRKRLRL